MNLPLSRVLVLALALATLGTLAAAPAWGFFGDDETMNSDRIARALLDASEDEDVAAIVFRVSSPGGSVVASDQILAALRATQLDPRVHDALVTVLRRRGVADTCQRCRRIL